MALILGPIIVRITRDNTSWWLLAANLFPQRLLLRVIGSVTRGPCGARPLVRLEKSRIGRLARLMACM